ncbi:hypothetical protein HDV00_009569 [Rhizophlyctis rosea]|nr:hypothetical protein HDV00_009569 [Rhizophlyctis rosea]
MSLVCIASWLLLALWTIGTAAQRVNIGGSGASFPSSLYLQWASDFEANYSDIQVSYLTSRSAQGIVDVVTGVTNFGGSDVPPTAADAGNVTLITARSIAGMIVVAYNIPNLNYPLNLTRQNVADMFAGRISNWNDPAFTARNPGLRTALTGVAITASTIQLVVRRPGSGTTYNFMTALKQFDPAFPSDVTNAVDWKGIIGNNGSRTVYEASTNEAIGAVVSTVPWTLTYMDGHETQVANNGTAASGKLIGVANIINKNGDVVVPGPASMEAAQSQLPGTGQFLQPIDSAAPGAYPITVNTHFVIRNNTFAKDLDTARWTLRFLWWCINRGAKEAVQLGFSPLHENILTESNRFLQSIGYQGKLLANQSVCDYPIGHPQGCKHGHCALDLPFQDPSATCICDPGWMNVKGIDCSEGEATLAVEAGNILTILVLVFSIVGVLVVVVIWALMFTFRDHPAVRAISPRCCWLILVGCFVGVLGGLWFAFIPNRLSCTMRLAWAPVASGLVFG